MEVALGGRTYARLETECPCPARWQNVVSGLESPRGRFQASSWLAGPLRARVRGLLPVPLSFSIREAGFGPAPSSNPESQPGAKHTRKVRVRALG